MQRRATREKRTQRRAEQKNDEGGADAAKRIRREKG
jgi:hypothetical protein